MSDIVNLAQAGSVVMACWAIISGIGAWKREFIGKRQIELAEQVLAKFFEIKDAIAMIRSPFSHSGEGSTRQKGEYEAPETAQLAVSNTSRLWMSSIAFATMAGVMLAIGSLPRAG